MTTLRISLAEVIPVADQTLLLLALHLACALVTSAHALLTKSEPRGALGWIVVCWLFPLLGSVIYWIFGFNRIRTLAKQLRVGTPPPRRRTVEHRYHEIGEQLVRIGDAVTQWPLSPGNTVVPLTNGDSAFPNMLAAIESAKERVWLASYIFATDAVGRQFIAALNAAQQRGVQVRVLIDGIGEFYSWPRAVKKMRRAGIKAARFLPPRLLPPTFALNLRNHRKLLIVDDHTCFVGGMNIGGRELNVEQHRRMTDMHFHVTGPVVSQFAEVFAHDWRFATREVLNPSSACAASGNATCRAISDGPDEDIDKLIFVLVGAISVARTQVMIMTPYFIPPPELVAALQAASFRGVTVSIVLPEYSNLRYVDWASRRFLQPLIDCDVNVYFQPRPFAHTKLLVIDNQYALVGSANIDTRSLRLNFEVALEIYDRATCEQLVTHIDAAMQVSKRIDRSWFRQRNLLVRVRDSLFWLLSPYL